MRSREGGDRAPRSSPGDRLYIGGKTKRAKVAFEREVIALIEEMEPEEKVKSEKFSSQRAMLAEGFIAA